MNNTSCAAVFNLYSERLQSLASAPTHIMRGCARKTHSHLTQRLGPTKEVIVPRARHPDYNALTLSLSHRILTVGLFRALKWPLRLSEFGTHVCLTGKRPFVKTEEFDKPL